MCDCVHACVRMCYVGLCVYERAYVCMCMTACMLAPVRGYIWMRACMCVHDFVLVCMTACVCVWLRVHACIYVCVYMRVYVYVCVQVYKRYSNKTE